jgi:hypothetical protein
MTFFALTRVPSTRDFTVKKLDINLWILPGFLTQEYFCDVGILLHLAPGSTGTVALELTLPFVAEGLTDLVPSLRSSDKACNLVFGTNGGKVATVGTGGAALPAFDDGTGAFALMGFDRDKSKEQDKWTPKATGGRPVSFWRIQAEHQTFPTDAIYLRLRFKVDDPGKTWVWQPGVRRRSHSISDLRVNEFRTTNHHQNLPDYTNNYMSVERVNAFVIMSARYKVGRVSPEPKYVRVLENAAWEPEYLNRRLTRRREDFIITYWPKDNVTADKPLRSFIEVERRRPTALKSALTGSVMTILVLTLLLPVGGFSQSAAAILFNTTQLLIAGLTVTTVAAVAKLLPLVLGKWRKFRDVRKVITSKLYRPK